MELGQKHSQKVSGYNLNYFRTGAGEPVLLVHGITTYSFIWRKIVPLLKSKYDIITVDLFGCGDSDKPFDFEYSIKNHSKFLREFITSLGIKKLHFIGHDIGGGIAQRFAVENSELLYDLTLINSVAYDFWPVQPITLMRTPIIRQFAMATLDVMTLKLIIKRGIYHKERVTQELVDLFWEPMKTKEGRKAFLHFAKSLNNQDLMEVEDLLRELKIPVMIIRGDADPYLSSAIAKRLHSEIRDSRLEIIPNGSHFIQEDEPEKVSDLILRFLGDGCNV